MRDVAALAEALKELLDATPEARRLEALDAVCLDGVSDKALRRHLTQRGFLVGCGKLREAAMVALGDPATCGRTYELGGPLVYSFRQLMARLLLEIQRPCKLLTIPWWLVRIQAWFLERLPNPMLTRDQVELLRSDNVVGEECRGFAELGIVPSSLDVVLPTYLKRFRPGGCYNPHQHQHG